MSNRALALATVFQYTITLTVGVLSTLFAAGHVLLFGAAGPLLRRSRLDACLSCPYERFGVCVLCDCFIPTKALALKARCPIMKEGWLE